MNLDNPDESSDVNGNVSDASSAHNSVKSTAVVKYSAVDSPVTFALLQCNTDLNLPPANWLSSSAESYGLQYVLSGSTGFSSFRMADMFPDCVGEIDVISDAENIKKLLKLPYSRGPVSMLVHRLKATLLIDDFDIHKFMYRSAEINWHSLKSFLVEHVFQTAENARDCITNESKRRYALQQENLVSKFLYHSIGNLEEKQPEKLKYHRTHEDESKTSDTAHPPLPEPDLEQELPDTDSEHTFIRNVVWTFENIQMLLGTDMPIFGGGTHPCVSLRLKDMSKPINVLTGIDYWLDNLMCNVPEVAMCYHIDGIVQKYELIKTEDLPYMEDAKFSPALVRDVAQNILAFLKSNATKAGHTYWLLKSKDDDVVKLYDLTSLCSSSMVENAQNPFTIPVALLLYRVARNMKHSPRVHSPTNPATIRMLLKNCIRLLPKEKYPQIITSAHYMFSDSLIPLNTDPAHPNFDVYEKIMNENFRKNISFSQSKNDEVNVEVKTLCLSRKSKYSAENSMGNMFNEEESEIMKSIEKRCKIALEHIANGLKCLKYFTNDVKKKPKTEDELNMAHPSTAIPMPYESIKKDRAAESIVVEKESAPSKRKKKSAKKKEECLSIGALLCKSHVETMPTWQNPPDASDSRAWKNHLRILLYEKACLVYATLAEHEYSTESYGDALKHIRFVLESRAHLTNSSCENMLMSYLLGRAGDCCFQIARNLDTLEKNRKDYANVEKFDAVMKEAMREEEVARYKELDFLPTEISAIDNILNSSWMCYSKALELEDRASERDTLQRRLGNICNELGSFYMKKARQAKADCGIPKKQIEALFAVSMTHLDNGIRAFKSVTDDANLALLYSNTGRLMRLMAHFYTEENAPLSKAAKNFYMKALSNYQLALAALSYKRLNPEIWDTISYELSTTLYTMATLLQDFSPQNSSTNKSDLEREVVDYLSKALKYCDMETPGPKQPLYQYRVADIHHRLASLYHNAYRDLDKESSRRNKILQLCQLHYDRAVTLYSTLELPAQYLRAQLEKIALFEYISQNSNMYVCKIKSLQSALDLVLQSTPILKMICDRNAGECSANDAAGEEVTEDDDGGANTIDVRNGSDAVAKSTREESEIGDGSEESNTNNAREANDEETAEEEKLLNLMESRLQYILRTLIKYCTTQPRYSSLASKYKDMYSSLLRSSGGGGGGGNKPNTVHHLYEIVTRYKSINES